MVGVIGSTAIAGMVAGATADSTGTRLMAVLLRTIERATRSIVPVACFPNLHRTIWFKPMRSTH